LSRGGWFEDGLRQANAFREFDMRLLFTIIVLFTFIPVPGEAGAAKSVDEFVARIDRAFEAGAPYPDLVETIDPRDEIRSTLDAITVAIANGTAGDPLNFIEMFRRQSRPNAATVVGAVTHGNDVALYLGFVLLRLDGGWLAVSVSAKSDYSDLLEYH
jgi:hypothetical protein